MRELLPFLKLYKKHWFSLSLGMLLAFATLFASVGLLTLSGWFISAAAVAGLSVARETFNYMLPGGGVRGFAMWRTAGRWGDRVVSHNATFKLLTDLRVFFFRKLAPLIPGRISGLRDGDLLNRLVADVDAMDHVYLRLISPVIVGMLGIITLTIFLCFFDTTIGLTLGGILMVMLLAWPVIFYKLGQNNGQQLTQNTSLLRTSALDWLEGHSELVLFGAEKRYLNTILDTQQKLMANQYINTNLTGIASALLMLTNGWALTLIVWLAADGIGGNQPDPLIAMFAFATMASFELLMPIAGAFQHLGQTLTSARRLNEITLSEPEVVFPHSGELTSDDCRIEFDNISFCYPDGQETVLQGINLTLEAGHKLAIVGQTGSGKSTLIQLLCRYWDVTEGNILVAGTPIKELSEKTLRETISVVSQRVDILNGTLRDNLAMAKPATTDAELDSILRKVDLAQLMEGAGLDEWLGDGGRQLSGGEKRRIGIARALLHNAPVVLLDEPTEGLDKKTEQQILALFDEYFAGKTVIFITHRLVNLAQMDSICLMEAGKIAESGTHQQLLDAKGRYYQLHQTL